MAKVALLLGILLMTTLLLASNAQAILFVSSPPNDGGEPLCIDDICLPIGGGCDNGYSDEAPKVSELEVGFPYPPGWYIIRCF